MTPSGSCMASVTFADFVWCTAPSNLSACAAYQKQRRIAVSTSAAAVLRSAPNCTRRSANSGARAQPIGDLGDHRKVVGDVERTRAIATDRFAQERQYLDLGRDVERGRRFVQHQNVGLARHRHRHHRPLQLPAGDLVGIARAKGFGRGKLERAEQFQHPGARLGLRHHPAPHRNFQDLLVEPHRRIEGGGTLRDIRDPRAAHPLARRPPAAGQFGTGKRDRAAGDPATAAPVAHRGKAYRGFACAGFADQPQYLAPRQVERDAVHQHRTVRRLDPQVADLEDVFVRPAHRFSPCADIRPARSQSTTRLTPIVTSAIAAAGKSGA